MIDFQEEEEEGDKFCSQSLSCQLIVCPTDNVMISIFETTLFKCIQYLSVW